ncbi:ABC transporter permease [Pollutimonas bauzanensis]|uniref:Putative spermidine/putrescine transport system permease protein n=1 Tax=Pollutimonas bauzanensis TaxID=658167 RepID=A0A1M5ZXB0_9BURK|nr:ABC transporter permease [Pollutimonas bauzanensis]SHI28915.1 putative spermidine/putrescine transport system permease protein [Pollutimonas bauzanensis]
MSSKVSMALKLIALPFLFFLAFFLVPLSVVLTSSFLDPSTGGASLANYAKVLLDQYHWDVILTTFRIAFFTTVICLLLGYPLSWYLVRIVRSPWWRRACIIILVVPLFTSNIVRSFGWMILLGRNGLVNDALRYLDLVQRPVRFIGSEGGILIGMVYILLPFVVLAVGTALARMDRSLEAASKDLGASPARTFFHITFPLSLPGLASGAIMVFALAVSAYVTPALLSGGRVTVLPMLIYQQYSTVFNFNYGGALSIVLLVFTLGLIGIANHIGRVKGGN